MNKFIISNLHAATTEGKNILNGISLTVKKGEIHAIMGPNGGGKSTLAQTLMGHPSYVVTQGKILLNGEDITHLPTDQKAKLGLFLGMQYPVEVAGVNFAHFLRMAINETSCAKTTADKQKKISPIAFRKLLTEKSRELTLHEDISKRMLNEGFSGGEKKKAEILQLSLLKPDFAILDEPDSGLDVDALKYIAQSIARLKECMGFLIITHYQRIFGFIKPDFVHVMIKGKLVKSGDFHLAKEIEANGYGKYL